jgi:NAD+ synthase (glutamine-hydrolysing)
MPIVYVNQVGGQDELVFDGGSFAVDASGELIADGAAL